MQLIWHSRRGRRHNHLWQFVWWSVEGCWFCGGSKIAISHWQSQSPLTQGWRYRAACDVYQLPSLVLIAQAVFLLECGQTNKHTDATERPTHAGSYTAGVGNEVVDVFCIQNCEAFRTPACLRHYLAVSSSSWSVNSLLLVLFLSLL